MKCPHHVRSHLLAIGQDVLDGVLVTKTQFYKWDVGIMFDVWRVLVAVVAPEQVGGMVHVSIEYDDMEEEDEGRFQGSWPEFQALLSEMVEEAVESCDFDSDIDETGTPLLTQIAIADERAFGPSGESIELPEVES